MKRKYSWLDNYRYIFGNYFKADKLLFLYWFIYLIASVLAPLSNVLFPVIVIQALENHVSLVNLLIICLVIFTVRGVILYIYQYLNEVNLKKIVNVRKSVFDKLFIEQCYDMDYQIYENSHTKEVLEKASPALWRSIYNGIPGVVFYTIILIENVLGLIVYSILIGTLNPWIVLLLIGLSLVRFVSFNHAKEYEKKNAESKSKISVYISYLQKQAQEIQGGKDVRIYQLQRWLMSLFKEKNREYCKSEASERSRYLISDFAGLFLDFIRDGVAYAYILMNMGSGMTISAMVFYINMVGGFGRWVTTIVNTFSVISREMMSINWYREFLELDKDKTYEISQDIESLKQPWQIEFKDVCFAYAGSQKMILNHLNLVIHEKEKIAIVGLNGAGKTTLIKLICGLYHPNSGKILINGVDIETIDRDVLFSHIAAVFQDTQPLSLSIKENIVLRREVNDSEKYQKSLIDSGFLSIVHSLPKGESTAIGKEVDAQGVLLSGGETQKLLCARALYKDSELLILDEPTAALDALAESEMYEKYYQMTQNKTSIFISHRLASTKFCDRIIYFEDGIISEMGSHDELIALGGKYAHLFDVQGHYYREGGDVDEKY